MPRRLALALALLAAPARADVTYLGRAAVPGNARDLSGLNERLEDGSPHDRLGGFGSGIAYTGVGETYVCVSDRGPGDGAARSAARVHTFTIRVRPGASPAVTAELVATTLLSDPFGNRFPGSLGALPPAGPGKPERLDCEGIRVGRAGNWFVSDEYGPSVREFDPKTGRQLRALPIPAAFTPEKPFAEPAKELNQNRRGRAPNRGFEGLAVTPDGSSVVAMLQGPLIQDGGDRPMTSKRVRVLFLELAGGASREYVYELDDPKYGANAMLAVGGREFLVLERDPFGGREAKAKRVYRADFSAATDVSRIEKLPAGPLPAGVRPAAKALFADLLAPKLGVAGESCPEKFEGLAWGPDLPDGRRLLLVTVDNDFVVAKPSLILAFAVDRADVPAFERQKFGE